METRRQRRNCNRLAGMINRLHRQVNNAEQPDKRELKISDAVCRALDDIAHMFVRRTITNINSLLVNSKNMQVTSDRKVLPAIALLFPRVDPVTLEIHSERCTLLDHILSEATYNLVHRTDGKGRPAIIGPARIRRLMVRHLASNKKTVRTKNGMRTTQTSLSENAVHFLTFAVQEFVAWILRASAQLVRAETRPCVVIQLSHLECVCRIDYNLMAFFSRSLFEGGRIMPTIHSARMKIPKQGKDINAAN